MTKDDACLEAANRMANWWANEKYKKILAGMDPWWKSKHPDLVAHLEKTIENGGPWLILKRTDKA